MIKSWKNSISAKLAAAQIFAVVSMLVLSGCGKKEDSDNNSNYVQPSNVSQPAYNVLPPTSCGQVPVGQYFNAGYVTACPAGYIQNGNYCTCNQQYNMCTNQPGTVYNGISCVPMNQPCPPGFYTNWYGICVQPYTNGTTPSAQCKTISNFFNIQYCVWYN